MRPLCHPLVSIVTPGWNGRKFVHRLLDSILAQTYDNMEYIYIDDGSTDGTKDIVLSYKKRFEERGISFKYIYKENGGVCSAIQEGLKYVNGECLCWPEYDDILMPEAMTKRVAYLESHTDCAVVTCDAWITQIDTLDKPTGLLSGNNPNRFDRNHFVQLLTGKSIFNAACHMVRMDSFDETHPNRNIYMSRSGAAWQMLLPIYYKYNRGFIDEPLVKWVIRKDSISNRKETLDELLASSDELLKIRHIVIDQIDMPQEDKELYKKLSSIDNAATRMRKGVNMREKRMFYSGYNYFIEHHINLPQGAKLMKLQIDSSFAYWAYELWKVFCCKLRTIVKKILF